MAADAPPPEAGKKEEAGKAKAKVPVELSAEDAELKAALLLMVDRSADKDAGVQRLALESLRREIRTATR
jgi:26S proteasome regulatory subunit N1